jgi:hypothetical protein
MSVSHTTVLGVGTTKLDSVTYNGITQSNPNTALSSFLYTQKIIEFSAFNTNNIVSFSFIDLPMKHQTVVVRSRVYTECSTLSGQNQSILMTLYGTTTAQVPVTLTTDTDQVIEGSVAHTGTTFTVSIQFGSTGSSCKKIVQDISLYAR